ncbi:MAG: helix-turn-helix transcriptional regulator [Clostridia bacterium]|nr:helix-turn-helix transcriptional regulator [Clostridia bacterium]
MVASKLKKLMEERKITIYRLSKITGIKYELLRRVFCGERKLLADELIIILDKMGIDFKSVK